MKKRVLAGIVMMIMVFASVMGVSAANSKTTDIYVTSAQSGYYKVTSGTEEFANLKASQFAAMFDVIDGYNKGTVKIDKLLDGASANVKTAVEGKSVIWKVFDLIKVGNGQPTPNGKHEVTLEVPALTTAMSDIVVIHYDETDGAWEVVPSTVDVAGKKVTATFDDLSPVAIFAKGVTSGAGGTSPSTGVTSSTWMVWTAAALIVLGAGVVVSQKKKY